MSLLNELLSVRDTRFNDCLELILKDLERQLAVKPYLSQASVNVGTVIGFNDTCTNTKLIEILVEGGLRATLNAGLMSTSIDFDFKDIDKPTNRLDQRLSHYRTFQLNKLVTLVIDDLKKQVSTLPSNRNLVDVYKVTGVSEPETTDYIVQTLKDGGLDAKGLYNIIQIVLPDLSYKRPTYTLNEEEKRLLDGLRDEIHADDTIHEFFVAVFNYLETKSKILIEDCLKSHKVYAFTQSLASEQLTKFLIQHHIDPEDYKCDLSTIIPCSSEEWRHCDDIYYILKSFGESKECVPLFNYLMTQI